MNRVGSTEVVATAEPPGPTLSKEEWREHGLALAGQWQGERDRPEQGVYEVRDSLA